MADEGINNMTQPDSVGNLLGDSHLGNLDNYSSSAFQSEPLQPQPSAPHQMMSSGSISSSNPLDDDFGFDSHITSSNTVNPSSNTTSSGSNNSAQSSSSYTPGELISNTYNPVDHDSNYNASRVQIATHDTGENFNLDNSNYGMSDSSPPPPLSQHQQHHLNEPSSKDDEVDSGDSDSDDYEKYDHDSLVRGQTVLTSKHSEDQQHSQDEYDDEDDDGESSLIEYNDIEDDEVDVVKDNDFVYSTSAVADSANAVDKFPDNVQAPQLSPLDSSLSPQTSPTLQAPFHSEIPPFGSSEANDVATISQSDEGKVVDSPSFMPSDPFITSTSDAGTPSPVPVTSFGYDDPLKLSGVASSVETAAPSGQFVNDLAPEVIGGNDGVEVAGSENDDDSFDEQRCEIPAYSSLSMSTPVVASADPSFSQPKSPSPPISDPQLSVLDSDPYCTTIKHQQPSTFYNTQSINENRFSSEPDSSSEPTVQTGPNFTEPKEAQPQSTLEGRTWLTH
ncbi:Hypothetical predicted protein [Octopus vulgaris]|uniref:Uncharacterized protein n=2 Tax=Octopus vulgaris TaxID=6645 RepID=A0AA36FAE4_OCTVU|nr:Hypothetical predicted protein [Octopus vulgaris]